MHVATVEEPRRRFDWLDWPRPTWTWLLMLGLLSRIAVVAWGDRCARTGTALPDDLAKHDRTVAAANLNYNARHMAALAVAGRRLVRPWYRWDAIWYAEVSQAGYDYDPQRQNSTAFLPLLRGGPPPPLSFGKHRQPLGLGGPGGFENQLEMVHRCSFDPCFDLEALAVDHLQVARLDVKDQRRIGRMVAERIGEPQPIDRQRRRNEGRRSASAGAEIADGETSRRSLLAQPIGRGHEPSITRG